MRSLRGGLVAAMAAGALVILPMSNSRVTRIVARSSGTQETDPRTLYAPQQKEYWLSADEFGYVRPGLAVTVNSIHFDSGLHAVVDVSYTDGLGVALDRAGVLTPGAISMSFVLAWWDPGSRNYTAYTTRVQTAPNGNSATQAAADSGGTWTDLDIGHSVYTFKTALPAGYDATATTTLGIYATRDTSDLLGKDYYANVEQDFVPNGSPVTQSWDMISNAACNTCHDPLSAHGGSRQDVKLCVLCHSPQTTDPDTGNTVDFKVMVHKIHMGSSLPSVEAGTPYVIIGNSQSVHDFSTVVFPQDIRNCATCHEGPTPPTQGPNWYTYPGRAACQSCHDDVNFTTGENHPAGPQPNDNQCASCHIPTNGTEWDASVVGAHTVPYKSTQLKGLHAEILSVANAAPGQNPTIRFQLTQNDGSAVDPGPFASNLNVLMGGPTGDYAVNPFREAASGAAFDGTTATYTFTNALPANATGTWTFSIEARRTINLSPHPADATTFTEAAFNPIFDVSVDGSPVASRRVVVDLANCNTCHDRLALHGGQRLNTQECVMCHNPNASDVSRRPTDQLPVESIDFKRMIHRIHTGEDLTQTYTIYGFGTPPSVNNFNDVLFPGDRRDCQKCHAPGTEEVTDNASPSWLATQTPRDWYSPQHHDAAACLGCHDTQAAAAHAFTMTAPFGEACATCHGSDADFAVDKVHAR
ncbi:MAG TPA: OmcA/MtrC family decaheme c-type cytochrome [Thermoanaerobaculia bacterium]|nr:OmcA/MtrC family decaheme c-type cytochrome [Thermoanaerobaculia bacterium]